MKLEEFKNKDRIKRPHWDDGFHLIIGDNGWIQEYSLMHGMPGDSAELFIGDIQANDWDYFTQDDADRWGIKIL